ncbi:MAG: FtsW/RodA/SpoVE family cell cycle protein [bacterium]|nr:FtsW/RodA/SpoVE family cell cycle protein [bacterium]
MAQNSPTADTPKLPLPKADKYIWAIYIAILVISVIELYSASSREVTATNVFAPLLRHGQMLVLGAIFTILISRMHYRWLYPLTPIFVTLTILLGVYVLFKGDIINGARRSTTLLGIAIQPAELLKLAVVLVIARVMSRQQADRGVRTAGVAWSAAIVLLCGGLLFSQGLTNTLLLMGISFAMMLIAGVEWKKFFCVLLAYGVVGAGAMIMKHESKPDYSPEEWTYITENGKDYSGKTVTITRSGTQQNRIARWLGNDSVAKYDEPITSENRQEQYSYMAQANGGLIGNLPGNSRETARLPLAFSDYIFAIVIEDWGFVGGLILLALYLWLLTRAGAIASRCSRVFPALLVMGMAVLIVLQALFHMAIVTGVFPVSGQPLPLISKGGSSILATSIAFGIMLSVSRFAVQSNKKREIDAEILTLPADMSAENPSKLRSAD